ncbi:alkylglycerol monooxygenase-like [Pollicipes pollicipes]|uniref:alkylglycerol monooxygenase-like n=1 Tax=Pollicipes pollicipes TaxID=41117 RepID=UPI001885517D|nr:alkylglycerol monooxygenase-like [Pollicipes pollicipes]XP_037092939.1 alkylglycerol monooxygenase-like [Pollicipes pollicipes]
MGPLRSVVDGLLGMFYVRNVTASFRPPLEPIPNYIEQSLPYFMVLVVLEALVLRVRGGGWRITDATGSVTQGLAQEVLRYTLRGCEGWAYVYVWRHWRCFDVPWDSPASFWLTMLGVDFGYYWFHRASHEVNLVWASHQVHHSSEFYNLSTALRQSMVQQYLSWGVYLPLALLGVAPSMFFTHAQFNLVYQFWIHTELVKSVGPLEHVLNTPSHHRVHHGSNVKYLDKNYAGVLIVWDRLFGTFCWEEETPTYGLVHNIESYDMWTIQLAHFRWIASDVREQVGWKNKLKRLLYGPGWVPGTGRLGDASTFPDPDPKRARFDTAMPGWLQVYTAVHFIVTLVPAVNFAQNHLLYPVLTSLLYSVQLLYGLTCLGWLLDGARLAPLAELLRCCLCLVSLSYIAWLPAFALTVARAIFTVSLLVCISLGWGDITTSVKMVKAKME